MAGGNFSIRQQPLAIPGMFLITVEGAADVAGALTLEETAGTLVRNGRENIIFDLSRLTYINTKGLGVLLSLQKRLDPGNGLVAVVGASGRVKNSIEITGLNRIIRLYSHLEEALQSLGGA